MRTSTVALAVAAAIALVVVLAYVGEREEATATVGDNPRLGDGPVEVFLFEDYQCSHCRDYALGPEFQHLLDAWVAPGNVTLVFKHVAFVGPHSAPAAHASQCVHAAAPDAWHSWDEAVYAWQAAGGSPTPAVLRDLADDRGVPLADYDACLEDDAALQANVDDNYQEFVDAGAGGTPAMIVAGQVLNPNDRAAVDAAIESAIESATEAARATQ